MPGRSRADVRGQRARVPTRLAAATNWRGRTCARMGRHIVAAPPVRPGRRADPVAADVRVVRQWSGDQRCSRSVGVSMEACLPGRQLLGRVRPGHRHRRSRPEDERPTRDGLSGRTGETDPAELLTRRWRGPHRHDAVHSGEGPLQLVRPPEDTPQDARSIHRRLTAVECQAGRRPSV